MKLHHIGVASRDLQTALDSLGLDPSQILEEVKDEIQKNRLYFVKILDNDLFLEIVVPFETSSTVKNAVGAHPLNLHHLAFQTDSIEQTLAKQKSIKGNIPLKRYSLTVKSFGGKIKTVFIFAKGLLIEFVENAS